jgi:hypothetical protein
MFQFFYQLFQAIAFSDALAAILSCHGMGLQNVL